MPNYDLIIRGGTIVDGTGAPRFTGDLAVKDGLIAAVGTVHGDAAEEIDAAGKVVAPGWVDVHTHYDGQATWDQEMAPSSWHGVTTGGTVTFKRGEWTGETPGGLICGPQRAAMLEAAE